MKTRTASPIRWWEGVLVALFFLGVAVAATWPLAAHFQTAIPCRTSAGRLFLDKPGDQLQLLYWFWLLRDNLLGPGGPVFMVNPYEFNMSAAQPPDGPYMYPLYFLHLLFSPLGDIAAYNILVLLSYVLTGLFTYLLIRHHGGSRLGGLFGALVYALVPSRIINMMGGHLNGLIYYLLPAALYFFDRALDRRSGWAALWCGLTVFWVALLEVHLIYYLCLLLGVYIPFRLLCCGAPDPETEPGDGSGRGNWGAVGLLAAGSVSMTLFYQAVSSLHYHHPVVTSNLWVILGLYPLLLFSLLLLLILCLPALLEISLERSLWLVALVQAPALCLPLFTLSRGLGFKWGYGVAAFMTLVALFLCWRKAWLDFGPDLRLRSQWLRTRLAPGLLIRLLPAAAGIGLGAGWVLLAKKLFFSASVAHGGRTLQDVKLYSPRLPDLVTQGSEVYLGMAPLLLILFCLGVLVAQIGGRRLWSVQRLRVTGFFLSLFFLAYVLGAGLAFGSSSLYGFFFDYFPFFNYPRVPARIMAFAFLAGAVLCGLALTEIQAQARRSGQVFMGLVCFGLLAATTWYDFGAWRPVGLTVLDRGQTVYDYVRDNIGDGLLLELPLWPGDSHQSSLFEYFITLDRIRRVNGYTPIVTREFVDRVYKPLATLNMGLLDREQYRLLKRMGVRFITVHENPDVFPRKVSPFPPHTTVRRLMNSPFLELVQLDNQIRLPGLTRPNRRVYLFRVRDQEPRSGDGEDAAQCRYFIPNVYHGRALPHVTGQVEKDALIGRDVLTARKKRDQPHYLSYGPYEELQPGTYQVYFRLRSPGSGTVRGTVARIDVSAYLSHEQQAVLAEKEIRAADLAEKEYRDFSLNFTLDSFARVEFRTWFTGLADLRLEKIVLTCGGGRDRESGYEAEDLLGDTGFVIDDRLASGGKAVQGDIFTDRPGRLLYGPFRRFPSGRYQVRFFLGTRGGFRVDPDSTTAGRLTLTTDQGETVLAARELKIDELSRKGYEPVSLEMVLPRDNEVSFNLWFAGQVNLVADRVTIRYLGPARALPLPFLHLLLGGQIRSSGTEDRQMTGRE